MKYIFIIISEFVFLVSSEKYDSIFFPNLPIGEFRLNFKSILKCNLLSSTDLQSNFFLSKLPNNETVLKGNLALNVPLDDSMAFKVNMAVKDSIGLWKESAHTILIQKACSNLKQFFGPEFKKSFGVDLNCPMPQGVYASKGFNLSTAAARFLPKTFIYGTYRNRISIIDGKNNDVFCSVVVIEVKRLWETD